MSTVIIKPWGVQVAGNFRRAAAIRQWQRLNGAVLGAARRTRAGGQPGPLAARPRGIYAVRIGATIAPDADLICSNCAGQAAPAWWCGTGKPLPTAYAVFAISASLSQVPILAPSRSGEIGFGR